jgi:hypothetical protein
VSTFSRMLCLFSADSSTGICTAAATLVVIDHS